MPTAVQTGLLQVHTPCTGWALLSGHLSVLPNSVIHFVRLQQSTTNRVASNSQSLLLMC